jgi:hypothetical protein
LIALALIKPYYESNNLKYFFWYYLAETECGCPIKIQEYSEWLSKQIDDDFPYFLRNFAYIRQYYKFSKNQIDNIIDCFEQINLLNKDKILCILYEKAKFYLRINRFSKVEEFFGDVKINYENWNIKIKYLYLKLLYKKRNMISARQALLRLNIILKIPNNFNYKFLYLRLKILYLIGILY